MIVVYGKPNSIQNADVSTNIDWSTCLKLCYESTPCTLAWQHGTSCFRFNYTGSGPVTQETNGSVVAFKVNIPSKTCPTGKNPPTFNNKNATGSLYITDLNADNKATWVNYEIYFVGKTWNFAYSYNKSCSDGFGSVIRSDGSIACFRQWKTDDNDGFTYDLALSLCQNESASLAGINYKEDLNHITSKESLALLKNRKFVLAKIQELRYQVPSSDTYARVDGIRTFACQLEPNESACRGVSGFTWTDTTVKNLSNYNWVTNSSAQDLPDDNCIVLVANGSQAIKADVRSCVNDSPLQAYIVFCVKPAWTGE
ncbi:unnamed protein product [Caenorhabditis brenneri]